MVPGRDRLIEQDGSVTAVAGDARRPLVVLLVGEPGSGKTTLGRALSEALHLPFLARDQVRRGLFFTAGAWSAAPGEVPPSDEERAAAEKGTTLRPRPAPPRPPSSGDKKPGPRGHATLKFDYTHVGPQGAELFAKIVSYDLAVAVPALASQLLP